MTSHIAGGGSVEPYRVMVVDDSAVIRGLFIRVLEADPEIRVVASAANGRIALNQLKRQPVEVVVLDIEMPEMDGLTALPELVKSQPGLKVIMASTLTRKNAAVSMEALAKGAVDYIPKPSATSEVYSNEGFSRELLAKVKAHAERGRRDGTGPDLGTGSGAGAAAPAYTPRPRPADPAVAPRATAAAASPVTDLPQRLGLQRKPVVLRPMPPAFRARALAVGSSTGGPQALFTLFGALGPSLQRIPVFITQHMPATFTTILAEHLGRASGLPCVEAEDGMPVQAGRIHVARGDWHMVPTEAPGGGAVIRINQDPPENFCRPAVDPMLRGLARIYGRNLLTVILTGMGSDGQRGGEHVVQAGGVMLAQDEASSVVWGMPGAAAQAGLCSAVLPLERIAGDVRRLVDGGP
ncbi:chemotaxis response regulator protein-glutamate methylesterase [Tistrella sp. BH-R2-4]|uniref:Protein-glutamate methylesterase/protein-glutamine glutaminase n=2 Tax=Geminicoccaceae TaxID=2066434 RepID=A0ABU9YDI6_9PROT